jgi:hypothetical protein
MTKGYFTKEISKAMEKLAMGEGVRRQRVAEALADFRAAAACGKSFFQSEFDELAEIFQKIDTNGYEALSDEQVKTIAATIVKIDGNLPDFLQSREESVLTAAK